MGLPAPLGVSASGQPAPGDQANEVLSGIFPAVGPSPQLAMRGPMNLAIWAAYNTALTTTKGSLAATTVASGLMAPGDAVNSVNVPPGTTWATFAGGAGTLALPTITLNGRVDVPLNQIKDLPTTANLLGATVSGPGIPPGRTVTAILTPAVPPSAGFGGTKGVVQLSAPTTSQPVLKGPSQFSFALGSQAITTGVDALALFTGAAIVYVASVQLERAFDGGATPLVCNVGGAGAPAIWSAGTPVNLSFGEPEKQVLYRLNCTAYTATAGITLNYRLSTTGAAAESLAVNQLS